jgi:hypothetical protein
MPLQRGVAAALTAIVVAGSATLAFVSWQARPVSDPVAGWRSDLSWLVSEARRVHAGPNRPAHTPAFARAADDLSRRIPDLPDRRIVVEIQRLMALLGDGHSLVYAAPGPHATFSMLPIDLYLFEDGLFVVGGTGAGEELVGSRIVRFGSQPTSEVLRRMEPFISRDNAIGSKAFIQMYAVMPAFLEACGAATGDERVTLTVVDAQQRTRDVTLAAGPARRVRRRLFPPPGARNPTPLHLQQADRAYFLRALPDDRAVYVQFNQVANAPTQSLAAFSNELQDTLASTRAQTLIVDVRHNNGGNNQLLEPLLQAVAAFASGETDRRLYVLTSRATFSAAQNFITRLERRVPGAVFAGEPSMSSPNFTGEDNPVSLPFSGLTVSISNRYWQDSDPRDARPWIAPQLPVALTSTDWLENRDPVLTAVLTANRR